MTHSFDVTMRGHYNRADSMENTLVLLVAIVAIPLLLLTPRGLFAWRYRRALQHTMDESVDEATTLMGLPLDSLSTGRPKQPVLRIRETGLPVLTDATSALWTTAKDTTRQVQLAFIAAALVFTVLVSSGLAGAFAAQVPVDARAVAVYGVQAAVLLTVLERGLDGRALPIEVRAGNLFFPRLRHGTACAWCPDRLESVRRLHSAGARGVRHQHHRLAPAESAGAAGVVRRRPLVWPAGRPR